MIGAVLAKSREIAHKAVKMVKVEYADLVPVYTIDVSHTNK
jgi:xanthine dehydrogenase molybdopterin-binding subunit B